MKTMYRHKTHIDFKQLKKKTHLNSNIVRNIPI